MSRGILRKLLSNYTAQPPEQIQLGYAHSGKPFVTHPSFSKIEFNLSHSKNRMVFAFTAHTPIGIDIEYKEQRNYFDKIAYRFFSAHAYEQWKNLAGEEKLNAFFDLWVQHEALLKAFGLRLRTHPFSNYNANKKPNDFINANNQCALIYLTLHPSFASALAIKGKSKALIIKSYDLLK